MNESGADDFSKDLERINIITLGEQFLASLKGFVSRYSPRIISLSRADLINLNKVISESYKLISAAERVNSKDLVRDLSMYLEVAEFTLVKGLLDIVNTASFGAVDFSKEDLLRTKEDLVFIKETILPRIELYKNDPMDKDMQSIIIAIELKIANEEARLNTGGE